jgi:alpha 1,3-mannosyltransferase
VIDKRKLHVLIGLLHTCSQNSSPVRNDITYKVFYGDKESYWIGMALAKVPYVFEKNWVGIAGELQERDGKKQTAHSIHPAQLLSGPARANTKIR